MSFCPNCGYNLTTIEPKVEEPKENILDGYTVEAPKGVEIAQPTYLDNRTRLHKLATRPIPMIQPKRLDSELDSFSYKGDALFFGNGLEQTY